MDYRTLIYGKKSPLISLAPVNSFPSLGKIAIY